MTAGLPDRAAGREPCVMCAHAAIRHYRTDWGDGGCNDCNCPGYEPDTPALAARPAPDDALRAAMIAALPGAEPWGDVVDRLLPVVREAIADELDAAAKELKWAIVTDEIGNPMDVVRDLRARAAAVLAAPRQRQETGMSDLWPYYGKPCPDAPHERRSHGRVG